MNTVSTGNVHAIGNEWSGKWLQSSQFAFQPRQQTVVTPSRKFSQTLVTAPPVHFQKEEHILVVEGTARVLYGDKIFHATAGTVVSLARGIPHAWGNPADTLLRLVITATPGGVEEVLRLIATSGDQLELVALADKYAVRLIGPPLLAG